jgi:hypothetical protein
MKDGAADMPYEILTPGTASQIAQGSAIGDRGTELLHLMCFSFKPLSISCRSSSAK